MKLIINKTIYGKKVNPDKVYEGKTLVDIVFDEVYRNCYEEKTLERIVAEAHDSFTEEKCKCDEECECDHDALWEEFKNLSDLEKRLNKALQTLASNDNWEYEIREDEKT